MTTLCLYNTNLDAVYTVPELSLAPEDPHDYTPNSFFAELARCMRTGEGAEVPIFKSTADFLRSAFPWKFQAGGNAGNVANVLAMLGEHPVLNVPVPTPRQMAALDPRVLIPRAGKLVPPNEAAVAGDGLVQYDSLVHYVCQFQKGARLIVGGETFCAPRDNRLIATYDVSNSRLVMDSDFSAFVSKTKISKAILSGFQLCSRFYLEQAIEQVAQLTENNPEIYTHVELGCSQYPEDYDWFVAHLPVSSLGMNENEFQQIVGQEPEWFNIVENIASVSNVNRICVHTKDFVISFLRDCKDPEKEVEALEFGIDTVTAAIGGLFFGENMVGAEVCSELDGRPYRRGSIFELDEGTVVVVPAYEVEIPSHSVGLGDTFTAASFHYATTAKAMS